jgi:hypothetical protein
MSRGLFTSRTKNKWVHGISVELQAHNCLFNVTALEESSWSFNFQFWISISRLEQVSAYLAGENNVRVMCNKYSYFVKFLVSEYANEARLIVLMGYNNIFFFHFLPAERGWRWAHYVELVRASIIVCPLLQTCWSSFPEISRSLCDRPQLTVL